MSDLHLIIMTVVGIFFLQVLLEFPELQILYLHGNQIGDVKEVAKLSGLTKLRKVTLHGNPLEKTKV